MSLQEPWEFEYKRQRRALAYARANPVVEPDPEPCDHKFVKIYKGVYKLCIRCGERRGPFKAIDYGFNDYARVRFRNTSPDRTKEARDTFHEMLLSLSLSPSHVGELCLIHERYNTMSLRCRTRSLCAAILRQWMSEGAKRLSIESVSMGELSRKCGVSKGTITKVCKQISNK